MLYLDIPVPYFLLLEEGSYVKIRSTDVRELSGYSL